MQKKAVNILSSISAVLVFALTVATTAFAQTNTSLGTGALTGNTGTFNTGLGYLALSNSNSASETTAVGSQALYVNTVGTNNTAIGVRALFSNTSGNENTATGFTSLSQSTTGSQNTATGAYALENDTTGYGNTAAGDSALFYNTKGFHNVAVGQFALRSNTSAYLNTAIGVSALSRNSTGLYNTAAGANALQQSTTGSSNTATGNGALYFNSTGFNNTAAGDSALVNNTIGGNNTALGSNALLSNSTGQNNIGVGRNAGYYLTTGSNNIEIGSLGVAAEASTIRIGKQGTQTATFIAGISGVSVTGPDVVVNVNGRLGVVLSSARYKRDIRDMGGSTEQLLKLRPVTFRYKDDHQGIQQYGLVAEEVERVYPELVTYGADGKVESVRYSMLTSMLLNELQKQNRELRVQTAKNERQGAKIAQLEERLSMIEKSIASKKQPLQIGSIAR